MHQDTGMDLDQYLSLPDAPNMASFAKLLDGAVSASFVAQWRRWYAGGRKRAPAVRQPSPMRCVEFVRIDRRMTLQALRPDDWFDIWPNLTGAAKAAKAKRTLVEA